MTDWNEAWASLGGGSADSPPSSMRDFRRAIRNCAGKPVAFHMGDGFGAVAGALLEKVGRGERVSEAQLQDMFARSGPVFIPGGSGKGATAVVSLRGVALYNVEMQPYAFSTLHLARTVNQLAADPQVSSILLDIDSPGGAVTGTAEAGDAIFAARQKKPVVALVNALAASAAYWIASQASEIIAIPSGDAGSIGVFVAHTDCSKMLDEAGVKITYIHAGEHKVDGNSTQPLSASAKEYYQSEVDDIYRAFLKAVARGRRTSVQNVQQNFGKGRTVSAANALRLGMVDRIETPDNALRIASSPSALRAARIARLAHDAPPSAAETERRRVAAARRRRIQALSL
jgi:signal peptide peptidase SppA